MSWAAHFTAADRAAIELLGGPVRYAPAVGAPVDVTGIFDATYRTAGGGEAGVQSSAPAVFLRLEDLPTDPELDEPTITIDDVTYRVANVEKDGMGGVVLRLQLWRTT